MVTTAPRVLIVDDDAAIRDLLAFSFGRAGFEIYTAADGQYALDAVAEHDLDLVILDWMMPRLDGIEFCLRLQADEAHCTLPVIFLSARTSDLDLLIGRIAGATDFVTKPFSPRALVRRATEALADATWRTAPAPSRRAGPGADRRRDGQPSSPWVGEPIPGPSPDPQHPSWRSS